jgi:hypothetical protein
MAKGIRGAFVSGYPTGSGNPMGPSILGPPGSDAALVAVGPPFFAAMRRSPPKAG